MKYGLQPTKKYKKDDDSFTIPFKNLGSFMFFGIASGLLGGNKIKPKKQTNKKK